jgi:hypothetical protein
LYSKAQLEVKIAESSGPLYSSEPLAGFAGANLAYPSAAKLAVVGRNQIDTMTDTLLLEPIYLREPHITVAKPMGFFATH